MPSLVLRKLGERPLLRSLLALLAGVGVINALQLLAVLAVTSAVFALGGGAAPELDWLMLALNLAIAAAGGAACGAVAGRGPAVHAALLAVFLLLARFLAFGEALRLVDYGDLPFVIAGGFLTPWLVRRWTRRRGEKAE